MSEDNSKMIRYFAAEARRTKSEMEELLDAADLDARKLTTEEEAKFETLKSEYLKAKSNLERERDMRNLRQQVDPDNSDSGLPNEAGLVGAMGKAMADSPISGRTIGEQLVASGVWKAMKERKSGGRMPASFTSESVVIPWLRQKAASSPLLESNATALFGNGTTAGPITTVDPNVYTPGLVSLAPAVADLLPVVPITQGNSATYRKLLARTFPAYPATEPVAENATKPTAAYEFGVVTEQLEKLAAITKISEEWLEDDAATVAFLNADLPYQIRQVEDAFLAARLYDGVADASAITGGTTDFDDIMAAMLAIQSAGFNPTGMIITPTNWAQLLVSKYGTGAGDKMYVAGGPFSPQNNPWGLRVIISSHATANHPLIGDFAAGAKLYRKGGLRVDTTNSDGTDFQNNLVTIRVEMRETIGKQYPEAFKTANMG